MRTPALLAVVCAVASCYRDYEPAPAPQFYAQPVEINGPPGGEIDAEWSYAPGATTDTEVTATVTDEEIRTTLNGYGYWVEDQEYGQIWRPYATVVGVDFTPYETCGTWVWTDYGWTFTCDWTWGWLPFHYGYWDWFDSYWAWVPDYTWSPAWVDWRYGNGYVGWRPMRPRVRDHRNPSGSRDPIVRDHRHGHGDPIIRDHRRSGDADWRFVRANDFGNRRIRPSLVHGAEGLRNTEIVSKPPASTVAPTRVGDIMRNRIAVRDQIRGVNGSRGNSGGVRSFDQGGAPTRPSYDRPARPTFDQSRPTYVNPSRPSRPSYTSPSYDRPTYTQPTRPSYDRPSRPAQTYTPPSRPTYTPPSRPSYDRPSQTYTPSRPTYTPPSRPTYTPPSRPSYDRPSPSPSRNWSPSRSSSPSYSAPSRSSSPSYSAPSRSSSPSYSAPSRSSSSSSAPSRSSSSPSSSSSSRGSSSSSSHSSGGGRRR